MADYTTTGLIASTKRRAFLPAGSGLTTSDILQILTEELRNYMTAFLKGIREEYIIAQLSVPVTSATVVMPSRAVGGALRTVQWLTTDNFRRQLSRVEPERAGYYLPINAEPAGYMLQGNNLILLPGVTSGTVVVSYQQRPGQLVLTDAAGLVTAINTGTGQVTVSQRPTSFTNTAVYDFVSATPNFVATVLDYNLAGGAISWTGNVATISLAAAAILQVGDYLALAGETPIPQIPTEAHDLLAQAGALKVAQASGSSRLEAIAEGLTNIRKDTTMIMSPRVDGSARPIINRTGVGFRNWGWW